MKTFLFNKKVRAPLDEFHARIRRRDFVLCVCGHEGRCHRPEQCGLCACRYFRRGAYQPSELASWWRTGPLAYPQYPPEQAQ